MNLSERTGFGRCTRPFDAIFDRLSRPSPFFKALFFPFLAEFFLSISAENFLRHSPSVPFFRF
jgi:hypothetical protein